MNEDPIAQYIAKKSGLPEKVIKDGSDDPIASYMYKKTGDANVFAPAQPSPRVGFSGLDINASTISLTNTYTDPLKSYTSYGVPRNAFLDWNEIRAENQSTVEKWAHGLTKAGITALGAVAENTVGVAGGLLNLAFGENHSYYDNPVGRSIDEINQWAQEAMPNYYTKREQEMGVLESLGTANFWADKFANGAGYTLGSLATAWLGVGELALLSKAGNIGRMSKIAKATDKAMDVAQDATKLGSKQSQLYNAAKVVNGSSSKTVSQGIDQGLAKLARQANIKTAAKNLSVGLHMSLAEASVEAREAKNRFIEEQTAKWKEENPGQEITADVETAIQESAAAVGNLTFGVNLPLLVGTNMISFAKMFKGIKPTAESKIFDIKKAGDKWVEAIPEKGMAKAFAKSARIFGAPLKNSVSEGAQEAGQFITAETAGDYYSDKFADGTGDMVEAFVNGLSKSIGTKEGLESILIGALVGGGSGTISRLAGADKKFAKEKTANTKKALDILNSEGFGKVLENMEQSQRNMSLVKEMTDATAAGDFTKAELARRKLISSVANQYRKAGALDYAMEQMDDLKQLDETEFKKRWGYDANRTLKEQTGMEQSELIDDVKSKMERSVKRQEQVQDILRAQQPPAGLFARILDSFESEELRKSKVLESSIKTMYANVLLNRLEDVDAHDDLIKQTYRELHDMAPGLAQVPEEDFEYMVKTGAVEIDKDGEIKVNDNISSAPTKKLADKLNEIFKAKNILNPEDANQFVAKAKELGQLVALREGAAESYKALRDKPEDIALLVEAEVAKRKQDDKYKNKQQAQASIQNSESVDELNNSFPKNADSEDIAAAMAKREELLAKEDAIIANYKKMSKEEFDAIDPEKLSPLEESAYKRYKKKVDELEAEKNFQKNIGVSFPDENAAAQATASYEEVLSDIEARTFGEVMVSPDGNTVIINGRSYSNLEDDPLNALLRDEAGTIIGVRMTDMSTGNEVTWKYVDPADSSNPELTERENAIAEGLAYLTLLKAASIRPDQTVPLSEAKEQLEPRVQAIKEDAEVREKFEENNQSTDSERELAKNNLSKTAGLTDDQLRAQIETLKSDLEEINEIITAEEQIAREAGFTKKEFDADPQTKELRAIKKRITQLLNSKIKTLRDRKQAKRQEALGTTDTEAIVEPILSTSEEDLIKAGLEEEIRNLEDDLEPLNKAAKGYQDIIDGKYGEGQDVTAATVELKNTNKKIGVIKAKITKRRNLINKLNEERELEKLRQDRDSAEGAGIAPEGEEPQGKDINPGEGTPSEGLDGILDEAEVEKLRQQREEAERLRKQQEENKKVQTSNLQPIISTQPVVTISNPGELDVRLAKGEKQVLNGKVIVADTGMSLPSDMVEQTSNNEAIKVNHSLSSNPTVAPSGTQVRFEVREDTDWWISQSPNIPTDEHWKTVPIYMVVTDAEGVEQRVALLQSATEESGQMRRDIYNLHKQGLTPVATSAGKVFNSSNYSNARLADGTTFFYPSASLMQAGQTPAIAIVGVKPTIDIGGVTGTPRTFKVVTQGDATFPNLEDTVEASDTTNLTLGQVAIVTMDPNGKPILVMASTRDMTESGRTAALGHITAETPSLGNFAQIVGTNLLLNDSVDPAMNENAFTEINSEMAQEYAEDAKNFMLVETLADGTELITFFSPSSNSLVRMNAQNMKLALLGSRPMFSFVEVGKNEKGYDAIITAKKDDSLRTSVEMKLADEFKAAIMRKKFQVDKMLLNNKESYTSPITGETYGSYFEYLNSEKEVVEDRTEGAGTKAILAVDTEVNSQKSPFFDVGIKTTNLGTLEKDVVAAQDLAAKQIAAPMDTTPASYSITESPAAPVATDSDIKAKKADNLKRGDIITFQLEEYQVERVTENSIDVRNTKTGDTDVISKKDYNAELSALGAATTAPVSDIEAKRKEFGLQNVKGLFEPTQGAAYFRVILKGDNFDILAFFEKGQWSIFPKQSNGEFQASDPKTGNALVLSPEKRKEVVEKYAPKELIDLLEAADKVKGLDQQDKFMEGNIKNYLDLYKKENLEYKLDQAKQSLEVYESPNYPNKDAQERIVKAQKEDIARLEKELAALSQPATPVSDNTKTPIEGLNERLEGYGNAKVVLPSNFYEGDRPKGRLNAFKSAITKVADNLIVLGDLNLSEFDFLSEEEKRRLDALRPLAEELRILNMNDISLDGRRTVAVEKRYAQLTNQLANEFIDIIGKHAEQQLGKTITSSKPRLAALGQPSAPAVTQPAASSDIVTVYHHTPVSPKDFDFGNFQRGKNAISQFGDGLNAASTTTPFFVNRYGKPIKGEVRDSEFIVIDANMSQKEMYEMLAAKGFKFNNPQMGKATPKGASYVGGSAASEYDDTSPLKDSPGAAMDLFKDFQESNPQVKGVKVINHKIGNQEVDPFYVIYDAKSFYGPGSLSKSNVPTTTQPAPSAPAEEKVTEITGAEDTSDILAAFGIVEEKSAEPATKPDMTINTETGLPSFFDKYRVTEDEIDPRNVEDLAAMAARNQAQAENTKNDC